jgi:hypothetical protein
MCTFIKKYFLVAKEFGCHSLAAVYRIFYHSVQGITHYRRTQLIFGTRHIRDRRTTDKMWHDLDLLRLVLYYVLTSETLSK